jgi:hypothetical protein
MWLSFFGTIQLGFDDAGHKLECGVAITKEYTRGPASRVSPRALPSCPEPWGGGTEPQHLRPAAQEGHCRSSGLGMDGDCQASRE